jgi:DNA-binding NarL/FixJ family response regulator
MERIIPYEVSPSPVAPVAGTEPSTTPSLVRVWLVDDNDQLRATVAELLEQVGGIECARHFSSPDALLSALASKPGPDVILLDVQMGPHCGVDAVRPIKSLTRSTRVLMFTACFNLAMRDRALGDGASDYILKSKSLDFVASRIRNPAGDPPPRPMARRRASCPPTAERSGKKGKSLANPVSRFVRRTLRALRVL